ncbi:brachyurin-like [Malaya genurostris]|uniref:brachyurin-like n=1 Tax=Malaya genurostris TaxID=325434 RepID=UPI0026F3FD90|nr:brachyurin-like [Malaya genurostris]
MKTLVLIVTYLVVARAKWIDIDWSQVRPIEEFDHYWAGLPAELQALRNTSASCSRITNGQEAVPGEFPYQIALLIQFTEGTALCGGSVLTNYYILTAAHCVQDSLGGTAIIGAHNRSHNEDSQQRIGFGTSGIVIHSGYDRTNIRNDIAVVRLNSAIEFNKRVQPTSIPVAGDNRTFSGFIGTVTGFGRTTDSGSTSSVVMFTRNPIMTNADCLQTWNSNENLIQDQNICLSGDGGRSSCNGDSGGPLTVRDTDSLQVGIVSFGSASGCSIGMPSVYARVTFFRDWIVANSDLS